MEAMEASARRPVCHFTLNRRKGLAGVVGALLGEFVDGEEDDAAMTPPAPALGAPGPGRGVST